MLPIRLRQLPRFLWQSAVRSRVLNRTETAPRTFHLCYFSCHSYFRYLYCSLHSIAKHCDGLSIRVRIFSDLEQPLSQEQIDAIRLLIPRAEVVSWPKSMGWGADQIGAIWRAYEYAAQDAADDDIIARVDSDVFFFNDRIFRAVARCDADLVGDGHYVGFSYCQGGCYFFRAGAVRRIAAMLDKKPLAQMLSSAGINVEDVAAYHFAQRLGLKIWLPWFMMFPDELRNSGGLTFYARWKFSCAHFVMKNKAEMLKVYERDVLGGTEPMAYRAALQTP